MTGTPHQRPEFSTLRKLIFRIRNSFISMLFHFCSTKNNNE